MADAKNKCDPSTQFFEIVEKNLPQQDMDEDTQPINGTEYFLWMIGIAGGFFLLRTIFLLLF